MKANSCFCCSLLPEVLMSPIYSVEPLAPLSFCSIRFTLKKKVKSFELSDVAMTTSEDLNSTHSHSGSD